MRESEYSSLIKVSCDYMIIGIYRGQIPLSYN